MPSMKLFFKINTTEAEMLEKCLKSNTRGDLTKSEYFRLLLHRDYEKRFGQGREIHVREISGEFRRGRPRTV